MEFKDYYAVLGVARDATADAIKQAYRRKARLLHPDVSKEPDAEARMSEVNEAYAVLSEPERRAAYDAVGQGRQPGERFTPPPDWDAGFEFKGRGFEDASAEEFSDFFSQLFGRSAKRPGHPRAGANAGARQGGADQASRREDHHAKIVLDLADAWHGSARQLQLRSPVWGDDGQLVLQERTLDVKIPPGVRPGQMIRLAGQGGRAGPGGPAVAAGDLFLEVQFRPHPRFRLAGADLLAALPVAPWEAALGAVVPVSLPDGSRLQVRVPAGAQGGQSLIVRGKGLPGKTPGDLELTVRIVLPSAHDPRAKAHYEAMARELVDFDARAQAAADEGSTP